MADRPAGQSAAIVFDADVWSEEVERYRRSRPRVAADSARRTLEQSGPSGHGFYRCAAEGADGTRLGRCVKVYLPLDRPSSEAPYGFVFQIVVGRRPPARLELHLLAFGERHPGSGVRSVYERAHKRLTAGTPTSRRDQAAALSRRCRDRYRTAPGRVPGAFT